ncbi:hypothetical protein Ciccas_002854 [Cichlidogyrus casuarinus]|uniref:Ion transport domain-containing protein n=1 Tax=Cichlidogyrus casuarinus TaxID=1844966 RepID=A0ABD2QGF0_9PLAT
MACWEGSVKTLEYVKEKHYEVALREVNKLDKNGLAPIHYAAKYDQYTCLRYLSKYFKAKMNLLDKNGSNCLSHAAKTRKTKLAKDVYGKKKENLPVVQDENEQGKEEKEQEKETAEEGDQEKETAEEEEQKKQADQEESSAMEDETKRESDHADSSDEDSEHETEAGHLECVMLLLAMGADPEQEDAEENTPFMVACMKGHVDVARTLLAHHLFRVPTDIEKKDELRRVLTKKNKFLQSSIHLASKSCVAEMFNFLTNKYMQENVEMQQIIKERDAQDLNYLCNEEIVSQLLGLADNYGFYPIFYAVKFNYKNILSLLIEKGAKLNIVHEDTGMTPLSYACKLGHHELVREMLTNKSSRYRINELKADVDGNTALHLAVMKGSLDCVEILISKCPKLVTRRNNDYMSSIELAAVCGRLRITKALLKAGAIWYNEDFGTPNALMYAAYHGQSRILQYLLETVKDIDPNVRIRTAVDPTRMPKGKNALDLAIDEQNKNCVAILIQHLSWKRSMKSSRKEDKSNIWESPMRKLIQTMPDMAMMVMDRCITNVNSSHPDAEDLQIKYDFLLIDDTFATFMNRQEDQCDDNYREAFGKEDPNEKSGSTSFKNRLISFLQKSNFDDVKDFNLDADSYCLDPYSNESKLIIENHPLTIMAETGDEEVLSHPLSTALIQLKWRTYGLKFYLVNLLIYLLFVSFLSFYVLSHTPVYSLSIDRETLKESSFEDTCQALLKKDQLAYSGNIYVSKIILLVLTTLCLVKEIWQIVGAGLQYFRSLDNLVELFIYSLTFYICVNFVVVFLAWFNVLLFCRKLPGYGHYIIMFLKVTKTTLQFLLLFSLFFIAFGFSFYTLLGNQTPFGNPANCLLKSFVMTTGEIDYGTTFLDRKTDSSFKNEVYFEYLSFILYFSFILIMNVILMNLLIGLAVNDIAQMLKTAAVRQACEQIELSLYVENLFPPKVQLKFLTPCLELQPNRKGGNFFSKLFQHSIELPERSKLIVVDKAGEYDEGNQTESLIKKFESQLDKIENSCSKTHDVFHDTTRELKNLVKTRAMTTDSVGQLREEASYLIQFKLRVGLALMSNLMDQNEIVLTIQSTKTHEQLMDLADKHDEAETIDLTKVLEEDWKILG